MQVLDLPFGSWIAGSGVAEVITKRLPWRAVVVAVGPEILPMAVRWARRLEMTVAVVRHAASEGVPSGCAVAGAVEGKSCLILLDEDVSADGLEGILEVLRAAGARPDFRLLAPQIDRDPGSRLGGASRAGRLFPDRVAVGGGFDPIASAPGGPAARWRRGGSPRDQTTAVSPEGALWSRADGTSSLIVAE